MLIVAALIAAFWGVVLGAPTLRLRGDYLAIVTLGFGEIVPVVFLELDKYYKRDEWYCWRTFSCLLWHQLVNIYSFPYYYLILALIALTIFANIRLRDSRLGRAWVAIREDEIAACIIRYKSGQDKAFRICCRCLFLRDRRCISRGKAWWRLAGYILALATR